MDILENVYVSISYLADELGVDRRTVRRWFNNEKEIYKGYDLVDEDVCFEFLINYRNGKYMKKLCNITDEDIENMNFEEDIHKLLNNAISKMVFVIKSETTDEDVKHFLGHIYQLKFMPL